MVTLNQRVPGSSPGAPTTNILKNINNLMFRWEPAALYGVFGKLLGTSPNATAKRGSLAALPAQPGWSFATIYYHTSVNAGGAVAAGREVTIGQVPPKIVQ